MKTHVESKSMKLLIVVLIIILNAGCDQATKHFVRAHLDKQATVHVIGNIFILRYAENDGAFLSMGSTLPAFSKPLLLTYMPLIILIGLFIMVVRDFVMRGNMSFALMAAFSCILGGGLGNLYDRFTASGLVTDFMNFGLGNLRTGILNFADLSITGGVVFILIVYLRKGREVQEKTAGNEPTNLKG